MSEYFRDIALLEALIDSDALALTLLSEDGQLVFANKEARKVLGLVVDDYQRRRVTYRDPEWHIEALDGSDFPDSELPFVKLKQGGQSVSDIRHAIVWPDGTRKLLSISGSRLPDMPPPDDESPAPRFVFSIRDITLEQRLQLALENEHRRVREILGSTGAVTWEYRPDKGLVRLDEGAAVLGARQNGEFTGLTVDDCKQQVHPEDWPVLSDALNQCLAAQAAGLFCDIRIRHPDRDWSWWQVRGKAVTRAENGSGITTLSGMILDIHGRKELEQHLLESRQQVDLLGKAIEASPTGIVLADPRQPDCPLTYVNPAFTAMTGYSSAESVGRNCRFLQGPETDPEPVAGLRENIAAGRAVSVELLNYRKNGTAFWNLLQLSPVLDKAGQLIAFVGVQRDISDQKAAQREVEKSNTLMADYIDYTDAILATMVDAVIAIDEQGEIQSINAAAEKIFGYRASELLGRNVSCLMPGPHRERHDDYLRNFKLGKGGRILGGINEFEGIHKDGHRFPLELSISKVRRHGQPVYIGVVRDISERKRIERVQREFVSTVSHELRTPLTAISGALGLLVAGALDGRPEKSEALLRTALDNSRRLARLINDLLDLEKLSAGKMSFDIREHRLPDLVREAVSANEALGEARGISLSCQCEVDETLVKVDSMRFLQALSNLLSNAIKYSPDGGVVRIDVLADDDQAIVRVVDQGSGIPEAFRSRIFQKFAQADSSDTRNVGGTGLGLSISREFIEGMGGSIDFESREGEGSTFWISLPLQYAG